MPCRTCYSNFLKEGKLKTKTTKQQSRCNECHSISQLHQAVPVWRKLYLFHFTEVWKHAFLDTYFAGYHTRSTTYQCKMNLKVCEVFNANKYLHKIWMRILHYNTSWLHQVLTRKSYINSILLSLLRTQLRANLWDKKKEEPHVYAAWIWFILSMCHIDFYAKYANFFSLDSNI